MSDTTFTDALPRVLHPLDDLPEPKLFHAELGRMPMTPAVRYALMLLQAYLGAMLLMLAWRTVTLL